ncbi:GumC family protein [Acidobacteriota bacterium]
MPSDFQQGFEDGTGQHSLRDLLTVVFKRRRLILLVVIVVVAIVMLATLAAPRSYRVSATLLVNEARAEMPIAPAASQPLFVNQVSEQDLNSEIEILRGRQLIEEVVEAVGENESVSKKKGWIARGKGRLKLLLGGGPQLSRFDSLVIHLQEYVEISPVRKSNVIKIAYQSEDPEWATRVVGTLTDRYLERRAERYQSPQTVVFFEEQMREAQVRLNESENALERYVNEESITMVDGSDGSDSLAAQKDMVMQRLAGLETELGAAEVEFQSQRRQMTSLQEMIRREPERLESSSRLNQDAASEEIERALESLRLQRDALLQDFKPDSRHVRDINTQIEMAEERLAQIRGEMGVSGTESNPVYLQVKGELLRTEAALEGIDARVASLKAHVLAYRKELDDLNGKAFDVESLRRDAQTAEEDYLLYRKKHEEARISAAMDQEKFINVTVAQPAQIPLKPEPRGLGLKLLLSLSVGLLGGVGLAFGLETFLDRSFTTAEDVEKKLGIPHIASIPEGEMVG